MKQVKVLGSGCAKCSKTAEMIADISEEMGVDAIVEKGHRSSNPVEI